MNKVKLIITLLLCGIIIQGCTADTSKTIEKPELQTLQQQEEKNVSYEEVQKHIFEKTSSKDVLQIANGSEINFEGDIIRYIDKDNRSIDFSRMLSKRDGDIEILLYNANTNSLIANFKDYVKISLEDDKQPQSQGYYYLPENILDSSENVQLNLLVKYDDIPIQLFWFYVKIKDEIKYNDDILIAEDIIDLVKTKDIYPTIMEYYAMPQAVEKGEIPQKVQLHYCSGDYDLKKDKKNDQENIYIYYKALNDGKAHDWEILIGYESGEVGTIKKESFKTKADDRFNILISKISLKEKLENQLKSIYNLDLPYQPVIIYRNGIKVAEFWIDITHDGKGSQ